MDSHDARIFAKLAETLSFKATAEYLGYSRSAVSKRVARLEKELGVVLINRSPRSIGLTESGRKFADQCKEIERVIHDAESSVRQQDEEPSGTLRFSLPSSLGAALMPRLMREFVIKYPDIRPTVHFAEPFVDVISGGYDVVIRMARKLTDSTLVAQKLATTPRILVASPGYLSKHGTPTHPRHLKAHRCMGLAYDSDVLVTWRFNGPDGPSDVPVRYAFSSNNDLTLNLAACMDGGFFYVPKLLVGSEIARGRLQVVLEDYCQGIGYGVYAIYPQKAPPAKVKVFVEFVRGCLEELHEEDRWNPLHATTK